MAIWSVLASLAGNAASSVYQNYSNRQNAYLTNRLNAQLAGKVNQLSVDQWMRENAYNTPSAQMMRLKAAGINPNAAFSNGIDGNLAGASPSFDAPTAQQPYASESLFNLDPLTASQVSLNESIARRNNADANREESTLELTKQVMKSTLDKSVKEIELIGSQITKNLADGQLSLATIQHYLNIDNNKVRELDLQDVMNSSLIEKIMSDMSVNDEQKKLIRANVRNVLSQADKFVAEKNLSEEQLFEMQQFFNINLLIRNEEFAEKVLHNSLTEQQIKEAKVNLKKLGIEVDLLQQDFNNFLNKSQSLLGSDMNTMLEEGGSTASFARFVMYLFAMVNSLPVKLTGNVSHKTINH